MDHAATMRRAARTTARRSREGAQRSRPGRRLPRLEVEIEQASDHRAAQTQRRQRKIASWTSVETTMTPVENHTVQ
jgi:hypothetical protein